MNYLLKEVGLVIFLSLFLSSGIISPATGQTVDYLGASTLYVGGGGPGNFSTIQSAINIAKNGDTIIIFPGQYPEDINIDKSVTIHGVNRKQTIIEGGYYGKVLINADEVNIENVTIQHCGYWSICCIQKAYIGIINCCIQNNFAGMVFINCSNIYVDNCSIINNTGYLDSSRFINCTDVIIKNTIIKNNLGTSIQITESAHVLIHHCIIEHNGEKIVDDWIVNAGGIDISSFTMQKGGSHIRCIDCVINDNVGDGISLSDVDNVTIYGNTISKNSWHGISCGFTNNLLITHNLFEENQWSGITTVNDSKNLTICHNIIYGNGGGDTYHGGIFLQDCTNAVYIYNNTFTSNSLSGIMLIRSSGNTIINNNFINNTLQAGVMLLSRYQYIKNGLEVPQPLYKNYWHHNYWKRPRLLPKIIPGCIVHGIITIRHVYFPALTLWCNIDRHPALYPNFI